MNDVTTPRDNYVPAGTVEEDFVNLVKLEMADFRNAFFRIGFRLNEANRNKYYLKLGFQSMEECAETLFGFKKTFMYDLMNVARSFSERDGPMMIAERYRKFSQSQLIEFTKINIARQGFINRTRPEDSVEKIKEAKKYWKLMQLGRLPGSNQYYNCKTLDELIDLGKRLVESASKMPAYQYLEKSAYAEKFKDCSQSLTVRSPTVQDLNPAPTVEILPAEDSAPSTELAPEISDIEDQNDVPEVIEIEKVKSSVIQIAARNLEKTGLTIRHYKFENPSYFVEPPMEQIVKLVLDELLDTIARLNLSEKLLKEIK